jgi:excinuclease ABC subunit C
LARQPLSVRPCLPNRPSSPDRFNEERATSLIRGGARPDLEAGVAAIREVLATLPARPASTGCRMRAAMCCMWARRALRNRVANYTQVDRLPLRLQRMVSQCRGMTIVTTNSEAEALLLEAQLIKRFRPPYNVLLRDDKSFPFILLRTDHDFPRIMKHRGARKAVGNYYGPFASAGGEHHDQRAAKAVSAAILHRQFLRRRDRPCLLYQIKRCSAPCVDRISAADWRTGAPGEGFPRRQEQCGAARDRGADGEAAEALDFERAAMLRDRLRAATFIQGSQAINAEGLPNADIFAMAEKAGQIAAFFIRGGQNWGHRAFFPPAPKGWSRARCCKASSRSSMRRCRPRA